MGELDLHHEPPRLDVGRAEVGDANVALATLLGRLEWRPETLARRLNAMAADCRFAARLHVKTPYKWLRGAHPNPPWPALAAALLARQLGEPVTPGQLGWRDDQAVRHLPASAGLVVPWTTEGSLHVLREVSQADPMDRRLFLALIGTTLTTPAHEWLIAQPPGELPQGGAARVGMDVVDHLDEITARLRRMDDQLGGGSLLDLARSQLRYVVSLLDEGSHTDSVERRLHRTAAELLRLCGWVSFDGAQQAAQAQRFFLAGLHAAHAAGDRALGANILGFMSCQAKDLGQAREAVTLAETARAGHRGGSPKVAAILHLRAAEAYANTGESAPCHAAVDAALDRLTDTGPQHGEPDWCYWLDEAQANAQAGYSYLRLGEFPRARAHLRAALRLQDPAHSREGALRHTLLAATYLGPDDPEPERACHHGDRALDLLASQVDSARCAGHVRRLSDRLAPYHRQPVVRDFVDRAHRLVGAA